MPQPRNPKPIRSRKKDARDFEIALRREFMDPFLLDLQRRLARVTALNQAYAAMNAGLAAWQLQPVAGVPISVISEALRQVSGYNRTKMLSAFRAALGVDIRLYLQEASVQELIRQRIVENTNLIRTLAPRAVESLREKMQVEFFDRPFDQQRLSELVRAEGRLSAGRVRVITRDQTSKLNGQLNQQRQQSVGVIEYYWRGSEDERERPTHVANNNRVFRWDSPPIETGPPGADILCRCSAEPIITPANRARLKGG